MEDAAVLHIGPLSNADGEDIGAQHAIVPDRAFRTDLNIANDCAARRHKSALVDLGRLAVDWNDVDAGVMTHCVCSHCALVME